MIEECYSTQKNVLNCKTTPLLPLGKREDASEFVLNGGTPRQCADVFDGVYSGQVSA